MQMSEGKTELDVSVEEVTHAVAEITKMDRVIAELTQKYQGVIFDVSTRKGLTGAKEARKEIREPRYVIENLRKAGKKPILELGRQLDGRAKEMTERLLTLEAPVHDVIVEEETRAERERQAKIEAELARVEAIHDRIADIRSPVGLGGISFDTPAERIATYIKDTDAIAIDESFAEFAQQAHDAKVATLSRLRDLHRTAADREAEEKRIAEERAELSRLRAAEEQRQEEERKKREAAEAEAEKKRKAEEAKEREELERQRKEIAAENERIATEKVKQARRQEIQNQVNMIQQLPTQGYGKTAAELSRLLARAEAFTIPREAAMADEELADAADKAKIEAVAAIKAMLEGRRKHEAEEAELARQKAAREAEEKAAAERKAKAEAAAKKARYPGDDALQDALASYFNVPDKVAADWLVQYKKGAKAA
jgi:hypothetical protein